MDGGGFGHGPKPRDAVSSCSSYDSIVYSKCQACDEAGSDEGGVMKKRLSALVRLSLRIAKLVRKDEGPFPYEGCRALRGNRSKYVGLAPDLDLYWSAIFGHASSLVRLASAPRKTLDAVSRSLRPSFFDAYPLYGPLRDELHRAPDVLERLKRSDRLRFLIQRFMDVAWEIRRDGAGVHAGRKVERRALRDGRANLRRRGRVTGGKSHRRYSR